MSKRTAKLIDRKGQIVATAEVTQESGHYEGTINLHETPRDVRALFDEFEEIVNGQMFSFLDEIQGKIAALEVEAVFDDGEEMRLKNLQVFPETGELSFEGAPLSKQVSANGSVRPGSASRG